MLQVLHPIRVPFADDWSLMNYLLHSKGSTISNLLIPINGHQQALTKIIFWIIGCLKSNPIQIVPILSTIFLIVSLLFFSKSGALYLDKQKNVFRLTILAMILLSLKPMQNFFMPICAGWIYAIFCISFFTFLKNKKTKYATLFLGFTVFLAPFTIGLGITVPVAQILEIFYNLIIRKNFWPSGREKILLFLSTFSIFIAFVLPKIIYSKMAMSGNNSFGFNFDFLVVIKFVLTLIGSLFVPASRFDSFLPLFFGILLIIFIILQFRKIKKIGDATKNFFENKTPFLISTVFMALVIFTRSAPINVTGVTAAAPRYVTGSALLIYSVFLFSFKYSHKHKDFAFFLVAIVVFISGAKTGIEWNSVRSKESNQIANCFHNQGFQSNTCISELENFALYKDQMDFRINALAFAKKVSF